MRTLINIELYKIFKRPRTYIAFAAITALIVLIQFGLKDLNELPSIEDFEDLAQ